MDGSFENAKGGVMFFLRERRAIRFINWKSKIV